MAQMKITEQQPFRLHGAAAFVQLVFTRGGDARNVKDGFVARELIRKARDVTIDQDGRFCVQAGGHSLVVGSIWNNDTCVEEVIAKLDGKELNRGNSADALRLTQKKFETELAHNVDFASYFDNLRDIRRYISVESDSYLIVECLKDSPSARYKLLEPNGGMVLTVHNNGISFTTPLGTLTCAERGYSVGDTWNPISELLRERLELTEIPNLSTEEQIVYAIGRNLKGESLPTPTVKPGVKGSGCECLEKYWEKKGLAKIWTNSHLPLRQLIKDIKSHDLDKMLRASSAFTFRLVQGKEDLQRFLPLFSRVLEQLDPVRNQYENHLFKDISRIFYNTRPDQDNLDSVLKIFAKTEDLEYKRRLGLLISRLPEGILRANSDKVLPAVLAGTEYHDEWRDGAIRILARLHCSNFEPVIDRLITGIGSNDIYYANNGYEALRELIEKGVRFDPRKLEGLVQGDNEHNKDLAQKLLQLLRDGEGKSGGKLM